jgi:hypothetical protein
MEKRELFEVKHMSKECNHDVIYFHRRRTWSPQMRGFNRAKINETFDFRAGAVQMIRGVVMAGFVG